MNTESLISLLTAAYLLILVGVIARPARRFRESRTCYARGTDYSGAEIAVDDEYARLISGLDNWASRTPTLPADSRE